MLEHTLDHPGLGRIRGIEKPALVTQFLGVQYAILGDRFSRGKLLETLPVNQVRCSGDDYDATKSGQVRLFSALLKFDIESISIRHYSKCSANNPFSGPFLRLPPTHMRSNSRS